MCSQNVGLFNTTTISTTITNNNNVQRSRTNLNRFASTTTIDDDKDGKKLLIIAPSNNVDVINACNSTHCVVFDDRLPTGYNFGNSSTMMMSGISNNVIVLTDAISTTTTTKSNQYFYRTISTTNNNNNGDWKSMMMIESRFDGCLMSLDSSSSIVVYGGGRSINNQSQLLSSIELLSFKNPNNISVTISTTVRLSIARAKSGCSSINSTTIIFVGGWLFDNSNNNSRIAASDVVDLIDIESNRVVTSRLSHRVVGASVASLKNIVVVTGGMMTTNDNNDESTTIIMFDNAFDYGAANNNAVEQYDLNSGEWQYISNALTLFTDQSQSIQRVAFSFANQVYF
jgi:hypothetical protein